MSQTSQSRLPLYLLLGAVVVLVGIFIIGLNMKRDTALDADEHAWTEYLYGEWVFTNPQGSEELISFDPDQGYARLVADVEAGSSIIEGEYRFVDAGSETTTIELIPRSQGHGAQTLSLTRVDDAAMTGDFASDEIESSFELTRRR